MSRLGFRFRPRTLLVAVALVAAAIGTVVLARRSGDHRRRAEDHARWEAWYRQASDRPEAEKETEPEGTRPRSVRISEYMDAWARSLDYRPASVGLDYEPGRAAVGSHSIDTGPTRALRQNAKDLADYHARMRRYWESRW